MSKALKVQLAAAKFASISTDAAVHLHRKIDTLSLLNATGETGGAARSLGIVESTALRSKSWLSCAE